jgi:hypothetical protein
MRSRTSGERTSEYCGYSPFARTDWIPGREERTPNLGHGLNRQPREGQKHLIHPNTFYRTDQHGAVTASSTRRWCVEVSGDGADTSASSSRGNRDGLDALALESTRRFYFALTVRAVAGAA